MCKFIKITSKRNINSIRFSLIKSTIHQKLILYHSNIRQTSDESHNKREVISTPIIILDSSMSRNKSDTKKKSYI